MKTPRRPGQHQPNHILAIVSDEHNCHPMTEELLDTWWSSLAPEDKADIYVLHLDGALQPPAPIVCKLDQERTAELIARLKEVECFGQIMVLADEVVRHA
jgi:hypothetical protein